jgi:hypothetical protein
VRLGERRATTSEGHRAVVLEMAREFEDTFIQHIESGEVSPPPRHAYQDGGPEGAVRLYTAGTPAMPSGYTVVGSRMTAGSGVRLCLPAAPLVAR